MTLGEPTVDIDELQEPSLQQYADFTNKKQLGASSKFVRALLSIPQGQTLHIHLEDLKERPTEHEAFMAASDYPKQILEDRFKLLDLDGRPVTVIPYATENNCKIITDALKSFDPGFDISYRSRSNISKVPFIAEFFNSPYHCRVTPYTLEFRLCGKSNCELCKKVGRGLRAPDVFVGDMNIRDYGRYCIS